MKAFLRGHTIHMLLILGMMLCAAIGAFKITETPPTWMDEGAIDQVSLNLASYGVYGYQIAPDIFVPAGFLTTSYPIIYPVALAFKIFGTSLLTARGIMFVFLLLAAALAAVVIRKVSARKDASGAISYIFVFSLFLVVSFAPLYGHGKNMLGEIPGIVFLLASLILFTSTPSRGSLLFAGICAGLAMATKPIFLILIIPSLFAALIFHRKQFTRCDVGFAILGAIIPIAAWLTVHFGGEPLLGVFSGNPDQVPLFALVKNNLKHLFLEAQPLYFVLLMCTWWTSVIVRIVKKVPLNFVETIAVGFSTLNIGLYLATLGYYRYFFPGELLALIFFPFYAHAAIDPVLQILPRLARIKKALIPTFATLCTFLVIFQFHQTMFNSWMTEHASSTRTALLVEKLGSLPPDASMYFYNVPEAVLFRSGPPYYQYFRFADSVQRGRETTPLLQEGIPDFVLTDDRHTDSIPLGNRYVEKMRFDKYVMYAKK